MDCAKHPTATIDPKDGCLACWIRTPATNKPRFFTPVVHEPPPPITGTCQWCGLALTGNREKFCNKSHAKKLWNHQVALKKRIANAAQLNTQRTVEATQ